MKKTTQEKIEKLQSKYEATLRLIGWDEDCIFAALNGFHNAHYDCYKLGIEECIRMLESDEVKKFVYEWDNQGIADWLRSKLLNNKDCGDE